MQLISPATTIANQLPILILISFDGFRKDYLRPDLTPNLYDLSGQATLGNMQSMYITKTFPNHFSMVTGLYEDEHEIINNKMYDPRLNETFKPGIASEDWWNYKGNNVPIWTANEIYGGRAGERRYSGSMMFPGSSTPYKELLPTHLRDYTKGANWTDNIETVIGWLTDSERPASFVSMYFDEPDSVAHIHGPFGEATLESVRKVDSAAGYLVKRLRDFDLGSRANIIFVSDHGMAEVKKVTYLSDFLGNRTKDLFELHGNSPAWSVFVRPNKRNKRTMIFQTLLKEAKKNHYRVYKRQDIPPEYHYSKTIRIGDFFILADEGYDIYLERPSKNQSAVVGNNNNNKTSTTTVWGNHGWKPSNKDMRPLFMAYGPSFKQNYTHKETFPNIDLFPLMTFLLDLPSQLLPNNGSLARIVDIIDVNHFDLYENSSLKRKYSSH